MELGRGLVQDTFERKETRQPWAGCLIFWLPKSSDPRRASDRLPPELAGRRPAAAARTQPCP